MYLAISSTHIARVLLILYLSVLNSSADGKYEVSYKSNCVIYSNGQINWIPPAIYQSSCTIDVQFFPFDEQKCEMKFGSWTFTGKQLKFAWYEGMDRVDLNDYLKSGTWDIIACPGRIDDKMDQRTNEITKQVVFTMVLRRKTLFYTVNLIIPCVLISFVSVCVFALPADAGEKMTLCISILLALVVFMLLVSKILPPSLRIPLIAKYLLFTFVMNIFAIFITVIIINRNYRTPRTHRMPYWVRIVFLRYLPKLLFMERPDHEERWKKREPIETQTIDQNDTRQYTLNRRTDLLELTEIHHPNCKLNPKAAPPTYEKAVHNSQEGVIPMTPEIHKATESLMFISQHLRSEEEYDNVSFNVYRPELRLLRCEGRLLIGLPICSVDCSFEHLNISNMNICWFLADLHPERMSEELR